MEKTKRIYILLSRTETMVARIIRAIKGDGYSHVSIALSPTTDKFYSYGRRKIHNPLISGFIIENIHTGVFGNFPKSRSILYSLDVSEEAYNAICKIIRYRLTHYRQSKYNFLGLFAMAVDIPIRSRTKFTCAQFAACTLSEARAASLPKDPYLMLPNDFAKIPGLKIIYEGPLKDCNFAADNKVAATIL